MSTEEANLTVSEALKVLKDHSRTQSKSDDLVSKKELQQALLLIGSLSESKNFGVCADNAEQGITALSSYLETFGYRANFDRASIPNGDSPIYLKFNTRKMSYYFDAYTGPYRGVLVSYQSEDDTIAGTYGHFPLDLFKV